MVFEKIGGIFCQPYHNGGVFSSSRQKKHMKLHFFPPSYILFNYTLETNKVLEEFRDFGCKLCGLPLSSQIEAFLYTDNCVVLS